MKRQLFDFENDKHLILSLEGNTLTSETGKLGKLRTTKKEFATPEDALLGFQKKFWESLKKGFAYHNPNAQKGEPILHKFVSHFHTGALAFTQAYEHFFVYGCAKNEGDPDLMLKINTEGKTENIFELPQILAWEMKFKKEKNEILMNLDRQIYSFSIENEAFSPSSEVIKKLSPCGKYYAKKEGNKVHIFFTQTNELKGSVPVEYDYFTLKDIHFSDKYLMIRDLAYTKGLKFYDLETLERLEVKGLIIPEEFPEVRSFCISPDNRYLVQQIYTRAYLFDLQQEKFLYEFKIELIYKTCEMQFLEAGLGVRSDNGYFSVYKIAD